MTIYTVYHNVKNPCEIDILMTSIFQMLYFNDLVQCHPTNAAGFQATDPRFVLHKHVLKQTAPCFDKFVGKVEKQTILGH